MNKNAIFFFISTIVFLYSYIILQKFQYKEKFDYKKRLEFHYKDYKEKFYISSI